jgi:hypothetical protein
MEIKDFSKGEEGMDDDVLEVDRGWTVTLK